LNRPDVTRALAAGAPLPCDAAGPVFTAPWQAQAFAMAVALHDRGVFTWTEWAAALSAEIAEHAVEHGATDDGSHYYEHWLDALEHLLIEKGQTSHAAVDDLAAAWARAAEATPHGKPIELTNDPTRA
jgi:nitrile hydratase accessory protein